MAFKENLKSELDYKNVKVKELAAETGISRRTIDQYLASAAKMPSAENAVKIAQVLGVSVEYLVNGTETTKSPSQKETEQNQLRLYRKYHNIIEKMENFSEEKQTLVNNLVNDLEKI
jgi:transcriptional regulator with XRE-family HTH domain